MLKGTFILLNILEPFRFHPTSVYIFPQHAMSPTITKHHVTIKGATHPGVNI